MKAVNLKKMLLAALAAATLVTAALPALAEDSAKAPQAQQGQIARGGMNRGPQMGIRGQKRLPNGQQPDAGQSNGNPFREGNATRPDRRQPGADSAAPEVNENDANSGATELPNRGLGKDGRGFGGGRGQGKGSDLDELLKEGVISQETYDAIRNDRTDKRLVRYEKLLEDGKLTQEEYDAIKQYIESKNAPAADAAAPEQPESGEQPPEKPEGDPALAALVEQGVITQEQADAIEAARNAAPEAPAEVPDAAPAELEEDAEA